MPKTKNKPGIHLYKEPATIYDKVLNSHPRWFWHITARNGRIIARSSETYTRKSGAVKSIKVAAEIFRYEHPASYYDHSKLNSPLKSYL